MYSTIAIFTESFGESETIALTNLDDSLGSAVNSTVLDRALKDASGEIDSYLISGGYNLPLATQPAVLTRCCNDIARYRLDRLRARDDVRKRYEDAIGYLKDLSTGKASLYPRVPAIEDALQLEEAIDSRPIYTPRNRVFTRESLWDY